MITGDPGEQNTRSAEPILLEQTQFRFMTGTDGAESVQSVDQPDKFLHIDGSTVTLSTTATPVVRTSVKAASPLFRQS